MKRRTFGIGVVLALLRFAAARHCGTDKSNFVQDPECSCCEGYAAYLRENGFDVDVIPTNDLAQISQKAGVPAKYQGCHTTFVEGYVVDGHVPVEMNPRKLLIERPAIAGITLPGMPTGSPEWWARKRRRLSSTPSPRTAKHHRYTPLCNRC